MPPIVIVRLSLCSRVIDWIKEEIEKMKTNRNSETTPDQSTHELAVGALAGNQRAERAPIRILLSEGSSLSARQTITALGLCGYTIDVCDPNPLCISRFSRFVRHIYRCPAVGTDPLGYLDFVLQQLTQERYDVLLPVHEQAFLFAKVRDRLPVGVGVALAAFDAFLQVQGKVAFAGLMERLSLPQPITHIVRSNAELGAIDHFPYYLKTDYSTAGQGVWRVADRAERERIVLLLKQRGLLDGIHAILVQEEVSGALCQAQAVFAHGHLLAVHCTQTRGVSVGGGHAARTGVDHPAVRDHLVTLGQHLGWHGPLALDYLFDEASGHPTYIECNPRLVEPMNATFSGLNLADLTVRVALGEVGDDMRRGQSGIRSHSLLAILLGIADHGASRLEVLRTIVEDMRGRGVFAESKEDLTPLRVDLPSLIPLCVVSSQLLLDPRAAHHISTHAINAYSLSTATVETIMAIDTTGTDD
jgi:carbamoylphosphate synthase large subunit